MTFPIHTRYCKCESTAIYLLRYAANGATAVELFSSSGAPLLRASVCLPTAPAEVTKDPRNFWLKDYSENEGLGEALQALGIAKPLGPALSQGFVSFPLYQLLPTAAPHVVKDLVGVFSAPGHLEEDFSHGQG